MSKKPANPDAETPEPSPVEEPANLGRLRQILFGSELKAQEQRTEAATAKIGAEVEVLRAEIRAEMRKLESEIRSRLDLFARRIDSEQEARQASIEELEERQLASVRSQDRKAQAVDRRQTEALESVRLQLEQRVGDLDTATRDRFETLTAAIDREIQTLDGSKADRGALADLLNSVAAGLLGPVD